MHLAIESGATPDGGFSIPANLSRHATHLVVRHLLQRTSASSSNSLMLVTIALKHRGEVEAALPVPGILCTCRTKALDGS